MWWHLKYWDYKWYLYIKKNCYKHEIIIQTIINVMIFETLIFQMILIDSKIVVTNVKPNCNNNYIHRNANGFEIKSYNQKV